MFNTVECDFWNITFSQQKEDDSSQDNSKKIQVIPYVSYDRTFEFMLGVVPMVMYNVDKNDTISPASLSGLMGIYTTNKTWFTAFFKTIFKRRSVAHSFWSRFWQYEFTVSG